MLVLSITSELTAATAAAVNLPLILLLPGLSLHCQETRNYHFRQKQWRRVGGAYAKELSNRKFLCDGKDLTVLIFPSLPRFLHI